MLSPVRLSQVEVKKVQWVMPGRIPVGAITLLEGHPGVSKSSIAYEIAARLTTSRPSFGHTFPSNAKPPRAHNVILMQAEDDVDATVRPNLQSMGADLDRVFVYDKRILAEEPIYFPDATAEIQQLIEEHSARLLVIDPVSSFIRGNINNDQVVRRALSPLVAAAAKSGTAILIVRHLVKSNSGKSIHQGSGSIALAGMARSILLVTENPDVADEKLLVQIKSNLSCLASSMRYRLVRGPNGIQLIHTGFSHHKADDLGLNQLDRPMMDEAKEFLCSLLSEGVLCVSKIKRAAAENNVSDRTLRRAKVELGVKSGRDGFGPGSKCFWELNLQNEYTREFMREEVARKAAVKGNSAQS